MLTPARIIGDEILDGPAVDATIRERSMTDITRSNVLFGGRRALLEALRRILPELPSACTLLDVGAGLADLPHAAQALARTRGIALSTVGFDAAHSVLACAQPRVDFAVCGDALTLPFADASIDVVTCSQVLHHFHGEHARRFVAEVTRVARHAVIIADLRRSWLAAAGFWLASWPLGFHAVTRHDGVISVLRGFTAHELRDLVRSAAGVEPRVEHRLGFRITAQWRPPRARLA